jgi:hypothetical protein
VDGFDYGTYRKVLRGNYPYGEAFESSAQNLSASDHTFSVAVRLDTGAMTIELPWMTANGAPTTYPSARAPLSSSLSVGTTWTKISDPANTITFSNTVPIDIALQGYFQLNGGTQGDNISITYSLDCQPYQRTGLVAIPATLPDGVNFLDYLYNVAPGTHTLEAFAKTGQQTATLGARDIEFVSYPSDFGINTRFVPGASASDTKTVSTATTEPQPLTGWMTSGGKWTKLLEYNLPPIASTDVYSFDLEAYVQFLGQQTGDGWSEKWGQIIWEWRTPAGCDNTAGNMCGYLTDFGGKSIAIPAGLDGHYLFGDSAALYLGATSTLTLWVRKVESPTVCGGSGCTFKVGQRYMAMRIVPVDTCYYGP